MRCALYEFNTQHDDHLPAWVYFLTSLGFTVDVYTSKSNIRRDAFYYAKNLKYTIQPCEGRLYKLKQQIKKLSGSAKYDLYFFHSIEPKSILIFAEALPDSPFMCVVHNANILLDDKMYQKFFQNSKRLPFVYARHISEFVGRSNPPHWVTPCYYGEVNFEKPKVTQFCVQGQFDLGKRNYDSLLEAVTQLVLENSAPFVCSFVGRANNWGAVSFKAEVKDRGLSNYFQFSEGDVGFDEYYKIIGSSHFLLPLIDTTWYGYKAFFVDKLTSTLSLTIGLGVPPIIHTKLASLYDVSECGITYEDGALYDAMKTALELDETSYQNMNAGLAKRKSELLNQSIVNIRSALKTFDIEAVTKI